MEINTYTFIIKAVNTFPAIIYVCTNEEEVCKTILYATRNLRPFSTLSQK